MKIKPWISAGVLLGLSSTLKADYEVPGAGPDYNALIGGDQPWTFWVRAYVGYNDNVQLVPDGVFFSGDEESGYIGITAQGSYRLYENGNITAGAAFRYDQTFYFESNSGAASPDNFDYHVFEPALYVTYKADNWYGRFIYSYRHEDADTTQIGVASHNVGIMAGTSINPCLNVEFSYTHGWDDFLTRGGGVAERDGERDRYSIALVHKGNPGEISAALTYSYLDNDADGSNFRYDGHEVSLRLSKALTSKLGAVVRLSYTDLDYDTGVRREQELFRAGIQFFYIIDENWSYDIYYNYLDIDSNAVGFRGERNDVGVGVRYDF